jgi:hypothetical protein
MTFVLFFLFLVSFKRKREIKNTERCKIVIFGGYSNLICADVKFLGENIHFTPHKLNLASDKKHCLGINGETTK